MSAGDQAAVIDSRIHDINKLIGPGPLPWLPGIPHRIANHPNWGPYLGDPHLVTQLADQVRSNAAGDTPAWAAVARSRSGRADRRRAAVASRHPGRPHPTCDPPGHPTRQRCSRLATATRQATRRRGYPRRLAMAAATRRSPQRPRTHSCRNSRKVAQPHPGRLRRHPPRAAVSGRRRHPTRRPPRRSPLVAHPRPATANAEPRTRHPGPQRPGAQPRPHTTSSDRPRSTPPTAYGPSR